MAKVVTPITAKVEVIGKLKDGTHSPYRAVLFLDQSQPEGSEDAKIWKSLSEEESAPLTKGALVQLVPAGKDKAGNDKHNIVLMTATQSHTTHSDLQTWTADRKRALAREAQQNAAFMRFCWEQITSRFENLDDQQAIAILVAELFKSTLGKPS